MGIGQTLQLLTDASRLATANAGSIGSGHAPTWPISPWQEGALAPIVWSDLFGLHAVPITRLEAMRVPAIAKGRAILHALITPRPLKALTTDGPIDPQPTWLYRSDTNIAPQRRTAAVLDDLIFQGSSLLVVARGSVDQITDAQHCPWERWSLDHDGVVWIDDTAMHPDQVVWVEGPGPGLLTMGAETIRASRDMAAAWAARVRYPVPSILLEATEDNGMTQDEAAEYVQAVADARRRPDGAVMYVPYGMKATPTSPSDDAGLFENGRNALRLDIANYLNLPASLLDGSVATASLTYSTQEGRRNELFDYSIAYWAGPIEQALSLDNVCPRGQRIRFDFTDLDTTTAAPTGPVTED